MKAVPPREDSLVLEVIGVAVREPTNSGGVVAFRYLASEHGARGASTTDEKSRPRSDESCASRRAHRSPLARQQLHRPNRMADSSRGRDARLLVGGRPLGPSGDSKDIQDSYDRRAMWVVGAATVFTVILIRVDQ
jgi:hypothetical protein